MMLHIDGIAVTAEKGQSLRQIIAGLGLDCCDFRLRPIAAKIAGEVFNLNYIPVRDKETSGERSSIRRAMAASGGVVQLIRYDDPAGKDVYSRTAQFLMFLALHQLYPGIRAKMNCTIGNSLYVEVLSSDFSAERLKEKLTQLVRADIPLERRRIKLPEATEHFGKQGLRDKARLLSIRQEDYFDVYTYQDFADYYYGELAPTSGYLQVWNIIPAEGGFMFLFPDDNTPEISASHTDMPKFMSVCMEGERWCELMGCETVADLNEYIQSGKIRELIRVNEALHEKRFSQVADMICERDAKVVMLAGPSSSGKTTSANRLATQLRVHGKKPVLMSLDDYYIDRDKIAPGTDGKIDFEHINTIDTDLFRAHLQVLLTDGEVVLPSFNFKQGKREWRSAPFRLEENAVVVVEGLHALNPTLLPEQLDASKVFKLYVSPLLPLNLDDHNRIPTSLLRLLRRTVRDYETRGSSVQQTMAMWDSVRRGEKRWIFPYQEGADVIFNSSTLYELAILKKHIFPLLTAIQPEDRCYDSVRSLVKILNYVQQADVDDEIPPTSIVREFIGGNSYYK